MEIFDGFPNAFYEVLDNICISLLLGILGIAITIFTVIYSFMESNKQTIRRLKDDITTSESINPVNMSDLMFAEHYMQRMKKINKSIIMIIILDIIIFFIFCIYLLSSGTIWLRLVSYIATVFLISECLFVLYKYLREYHNRYIE